MKILVVLLTRSGILKNKVINLNIDSKNLYELKKFLNNKLRGLSLDEAGRRIVVEVQKYQNKQKDLFKLAEYISSAIDSIKDDIYMDGTSNVLGLPDFNDFESARSLVKLNEDKERLIEIIGEDFKESNGVKVQIGGQGKIADLKDLSVITTSYSYGNKIIGVLGIIGPKRMEYEKMMALVKSVSKVVNGLLLKMGDEDDEE